MIFRGEEVVVRGCITRKFQSNFTLRLVVPFALVAAVKWCNRSTRKGAEQ